MQGGCGALASHPVRLVLLLVACLVAAGCTTEVAGTPSAPPGLLLPPRPREVRLDGVDPCSLLTPEQWAILGFDGPTARSDPQVNLFRGQVPTCTVTGFRPEAVAVGVGIVTTVGIERWQEGDLAANLRRTAVEGFPAIVAVPTQHTEYCSTEVDVSHGQLLDVQVLNGNQPAIPQDRLCARATQSASTLMMALLAR